MHPAVLLMVAIAFASGCAHAPPAAATGSRTPSAERLIARAQRDEICRYEAALGTRIPVYTCLSRDEYVSRQLHSLDLLRSSPRIGR
jgi:hypothetical protein